MSSFPPFGLRHKGVLTISLMILLNTAFYFFYWIQSNSITTETQLVDSNGKGLPIVFLIGFNKVGTRTTFDLFRKSGIPSVHNDRSSNILESQAQRFANETAASAIMSKNYHANRSILHHLHPSYLFFSDFGRYPKDAPDVPWYRLAVDQYPGSKFILQIRSNIPWLHSKFTHYHPGHAFIPDYNRKKGKPVVFRNGTACDLSDYDEETGNILMIKSWREKWYSYMCGAFYFFHFERKELSDDLLIFDIEHDDAQKIVDFAAGFGMTLLKGHFGHSGNTKKRSAPGLDVQLEKWDNITRREPMLQREHNPFDTETERIWKVCLQEYWHIDGNGAR